MAITPGAGYQIDPNNPNGVIPIGSGPTGFQQTQQAGGINYGQVNGGTPVNTSQAPAPSTSSVNPITLANFQKANPGLTPTAQDISIMNGANPPQVPGQTNSSDPSLVNALNSSGQPSDFASRTKLAQQYGIQNYTGTADQNTQLLQKYRAGLATAQSSGAPVPDSAGDASAKVQEMTGQTTADQQAQQAGAEQAKAINTQLQNNPGYQKLVADHQAQLTAQGQSLEQEYTKLSSDLGLPALNTQLINMKSIMDGTEDDIRAEIQKAGGFATNSQVLALTSARNKTMIQNYNNLLQTRDNAVSQINTMIGLSEKDRAIASQQASDQLNYDKQILDYQDKMTSNAKDAYDQIIKTPGYGYQALYASTGGDPKTVSMIESTLGLPSGSLQGLASQPQEGSYQVVKGGTDAFGNPMADKIFDSKHGVFVDGVGGSSGGFGTNTGTAGIIGSQGLGSGPSKLSFDQYGLLANTNFSPTNTVDSLAQKYLDQYIKNGTVPTASSLGRNMKPEAVAQVDSRARDLYFQATGHALPNPQIIKGYQQIVDSNNKLANNLVIQEQTVHQNVDLSLANMKKNDLNSSNFQPLNAFINSVQTMFSDPAVGQLIAQNSTIQNELGSLLAVKNASGTTVFDKMASAGIISKNDTQAVVNAKVNALLQEASNFANSLNHANADLYKQIDPFLQDTNNPARSQMQLDQALNAKGINYNDLSAQMYAPANRDAHPGLQPAWDLTNGKPVYASGTEINSGKYLPI